MKNITNQLRKIYFEFPNISGIFYGYKIKKNNVTTQPSIVFLVNKKKPLSELTESEVIPLNYVIDGENILTDVVEVRISLLQSVQATSNSTFCPPPWNSWTASTPANQNFIRPIQGGTKINMQKFGNSYGTIGLVCVDNDTNSLVGLTNSHVICGESVNTINKCPNWVFFSNVNNVVSQPVASNPLNVNQIGILKKYSPFDFLPKKNFTDAAVFTIPESAFDPNVSWKPFGLTGITDYITIASTSEIDNLFITKPKLYSTGIS